MIKDLNNEYGNKLRVVIIAQPTQFTQALESLNKKGIKPQFNSIYIQGQYKILDSIMVPDFSAYNLREDSLSSFELFNLQDSVPFVFLSKYATYPYALSKAETEQIKKKANGGEYLYSAAVNGLKSFLERDSALFYNIFKVNPSINKNNAIDSLKVLNNPYDLLTTISIFYPEILVADTLELNNIKHINIIR